jgi:hypothetical protein
MTTTTTTVHAPVSEEPITIGTYKEFAADPSTYSKTAEEEGDGVYGKATVHRTSLPTTRRHFRLLTGSAVFSIPITSQPGTMRRNIPR